MKLDMLKEKIGEAGLEPFRPNDGEIIPFGCFWIFGCTSSCSDACSKACSDKCTVSCPSSSSYS